MTWLKNLSTGKKVALGGVVILALAVILGAGFGSAGRNNEYQTQNEFRLDDWVKIKLGSLDMSINKAVLYLFLAAVFTILVMVWIANRMQARPNRVQTAIEATYDLTRSGSRSSPRSSSSSGSRTCSATSRCR